MTSLSSETHQKQVGWLLLLIGAITLLPFLGLTLFNTRGEPREALVAMSMINDGNWILPINSGADMAYKPPFFHWMVAGLSVLFGGISEYTSRMPSALALIGLTLSTYAFYAKRVGVQHGFLTALLLMTTFEVHRAGMACRVDMVLTLMMVGALYLLYSWVERGLKGLPWFGILCLSGAFLSKGPVGMALPCLVVALFALLRGEGWGKVIGRFVVIALLSCLLPLAWYVAAYQEGGQRFLDLIYEENVLRLLGKMSYESHVNPWYYNVQTLVAGFVPYTLLVVMSLFVAPYAKLKGVQVQWWQRLKRHMHEVDGVRLFTFLSFIVIFVFYCIPKSKRSVYLLPVYPFLAYYLAQLIFWLRDNHPRIIRIFGGIIVALCLLLPLAFILVKYGFVPAEVFGSKPENFAMYQALVYAPLGFSGMVLVLLPLVAAWSYLRSTHLIWGNVFGMVGMVLTIYISLDGFYQPLVLNTKSDYPIAQRIVAMQPQGEVYSYRADEVPGNPMRPFTINYYLGDRVRTFGPQAPASGLLIVSDHAQQAFEKQFPQYALTLVDDYEKKSCDDRRPVSLYRFTLKANQPADGSAE